MRREGANRTRQILVGPHELIIVDLGTPSIHPPTPAHGKYNCISQGHVRYVCDMPFHCDGKGDYKSV
jgi:hypothetical protein